MPAVARRMKSGARDVERPDLFLETLSFQSDRRGCASDVAAKFPKLARKVLALPLAPGFTIVLQPESRLVVGTVVRSLGFHQRHHVLRFHNGGTYKNEKLFESATQLPDVTRPRQPGEFRQRVPPNSGPVRLYFCSRPDQK